MSKPSTRHKPENRRQRFKAQTDFTAKDFWGCTRKKTYVTERVAIRAAEGIMADRLTGKVLRTYNCPHCKKFHLTSHPKENYK